MKRTIAGQDVTATPCDGLAGWWRVEANGEFVGLVERGVTGWRALPALSVMPGCGCRVPCDCPGMDAALAHLVVDR